MKLVACRSADLPSERANRSLRRTLELTFVSLWFVLMAVAVSWLIAVRPSGEFRALVRMSAEAPNDPHMDARYWGEAEVEDGNARLCEARTQYFVRGKGGGWRTEARRAFLEGHQTLLLADGRRVEVEGPNLEFLPYRGTVPGLQQERTYRAWPLLRAPKLEHECLTPGTTVFVDGCLTASADELLRLGDCPPRHGEPRPLLLSNGGRRYRMAEHVHALSLALAWGLAVLAVSVAFLVVRLRATSLVAQLSVAVQEPEPPRGGSWRAKVPYVVVVVGWLFLGSLLLGTPCPWTVQLAFAALAATSAASLYFWRRTKALASLAHVVDEHPTVPLLHAEGDRVELAVRVPNDAPTKPAPLSGEPVVHAYVQAWRREEIRSGRSRQIKHHFVGSATVIGASIPIEDASGVGTLELAEVLRDFPSKEALVLPTEVPREILKALGGLEVGEHLLRESVLRPNDPLYVLGPVRRVLEPSGAVHAAYRVSPTRPQVASVSEQDVWRVPFVHAGTERELLTTLRRAMRREGFAAGLLVAAAASSTLLLFYSVSMCLW